MHEYLSGLEQRNGPAYLSIPAMCMVPDARTAREGKYLKTAGVVKFAVGQSGSIVFLRRLRCRFPLIDTSCALFWSATIRWNQTASRRSWGQISSSKGEDFSTESILYSASTMNL
jgi:hypothetical protein